MNMAKKKRRYISMLVFFTFLLNFCVPCLPMQAEATKNNITEGSLAESGSFSDIAGHWAEKEIKAWTARELAGGYPDGSFRPDSPITRAEFVTLVNRAFGYSNMAKTSNTYRDVAATDWFAGEIANGAAVGYLGGYPDGTVKPQNPLTRQEAAAIFARILPTNNNVLTDNNSNNSNNGNMDNTLAQFTDQAQIPEWSQAAIAAAVKVGYMNGYPDGSFQPAKPITRAEALSVLDRTVGTLYNRAGTYGPFQGTVVLEGNVTINTPGITLQNTTITGNLYLTEGIGEGDVTLDGVTVQGITKIAGGGRNSIHLLNTSVGAVLVNVPSRRLVRLLAQGSTDVGTLEARTPAILEEEGLSAAGFTKVVIKAQEGSSQGTKAAITVELAGEFSDVEIEEATVQLDLQKGRIANLSLSSSAHAAQINLAAETTVQILLADTAATIQGQGTVEKAQANVDGVVIEAQAKNVQVADGIQANVAGKTITEDYKYVEPKKKKSRDAALSDLMIDGITVAGFAPDTLSYDVVLPYGTTEEEIPTVTAEAHHAKARITVTQATGLTAPDNTATVLVTAENGTTQTYTVCFTVAENSAKAITSFVFMDLDPVVTGDINEGIKTITVTVPYGTNVTSLVPTIEHTGVSISPAAEIPQDFTDSVTNPVIYTVTAADDSTATYEVTVYVALNDEVSLSTFIIGGQDVKELAGVNTEEGATLAVSDFTYFRGIEVETTDPNASATVTLNGMVVAEGKLATQAIEPNDVIIVTVTAEDGETEGQYKVTVEYGPIEDFDCTDNNGSSATFTWTVAEGAEALKIQQSTNDGETWEEAYTPAINTEATTSTVVGLTAGATYKFKLVVTGGNNAGDSNIVEVTTNTNDYAAEYGTSWDSSTGSTAMTRLGDATGKTAGAHFNDFAPWSGMKRCTMDEQVMVTIPKFYYKHTYADGVHEFWVADGPAEGFKLHPAFIRAGVEKDYIYMGAYKASLGRNQADTADALASVSGALPAVSKNITQFRTLAEARGQGWTLADALTRNAVALLYLVEYADTDSQSTTVGIGKGITELRYTADDKVTDIVLEDGIQNNDKLIVSYANTGKYYDVGQIIDVGTELGKRDIWKNRMITEVEKVDDNTTITVTGGEIPGTAEKDHILYHVGQKTGGCDKLDGVSGSATKYSDGVTPGGDGKVSINYRGLEDLWGNVWEFVDGININDHRPYVADHGFVSNKFSEPYKASGIILPSGNGYVRDFACSAGADWLLMPSAVGGSDSTYIPDYYYQATGNRVALVGGNWNRGARAGLFGWTVANSSSSADLTVGARALLIP